jgi:hypothetical protein
MSLKAFHLIFIVASILLVVGLGVWSLMNYLSADGRVRDLLIAIASALVVVALICYERYFQKKLKNVSYL